MNRGSRDNSRDNLGAGSLRVSRCPLRVIGYDNADWTSDAYTLGFLAGRRSSSVLLAAAPHPAAGTAAVRVSSVRSIVGEMLRVPSAGLPVAGSNSI